MTVRELVELLEMFGEDDSMNVVVSTDTGPREIAGLAVDHLVKHGKPGDMAKASFTMVEVEPTIYIDLA